MAKSSHPIPKVTVTYGQRPKRSHRWPIGLLIFIVLIFVCLSYVLYYQHQVDRTYRETIYQAHSETESDRLQGPIALIALNNQIQQGVTQENVAWLNIITLDATEPQVNQLVMPLDLYHLPSQSWLFDYGRQGVGRGIDQLIDAQVAIQHQITVRLNRLRPLLDLVGSIDIILPNEITIAERTFPAQQTITLTPLEMDQLLSRSTGQDYQHLYQIQQTIIQELFTTIQSRAYRLKWVEVLECLKEAVVTDIPFNNRYLWSIQHYHWETEFLSDRVNIRYNAEENRYEWQESLQEVIQ